MSILLEWAPTVCILILLFVGIFSEHIEPGSFFGAVLGTVYFLSFCLSVIHIIGV